MILYFLGLGYKQLMLYERQSHKMVKLSSVIKVNIEKIFHCQTVSAFEYKPNIVSDCDMMIGEVELKKQELDILKIVAYYQDHESLNPHLVVPNYLKLPQALESCHD